MDIRYERRHHLAVVTLNRPEALNALSYEMVRDLDARLRAYAVNRNIRAVLIQGAGERAFCTGGDIRALYQSATTMGDLHQRFFAAEYRLDYFLHTYPKPYVVLLDGLTLGGGMGIAQGSRLRVVTERSRLGMPEVAIGFFPDVGGNFFLSRLPGALGAYLALTGLHIDAADALYAGLADACLPSAALDPLEQALGELNWSDDGHADVRGVIHDHAAADVPSPTLAALRPAIDVHFTQADVIAILRSLQSEQRPEYAEWAQQTYRLLRSRSPTMLAVSLRALQHGKTLSLAECFRMELGMARHCFVHGDFLEGVRALIIDKDHAPRWNPPRIEDVTAAMVELFFNPNVP